MAVTRLSNSGIKTGVLKYDSTLAGYPGVMPAPTATDAGTGTSATVSFSTVSGATGYRAISTPGSFTGTGTTSPITVSGLTTGTTYTFQIQAQNTVGYGGLSAASNSVTPIAPGSFDSIATLTASGSVSSVTFSSIPQTYSHLQIRIKLRGSGLMATQDIFSQLNGSTFNYGRYNFQNAIVSFAQANQNEFRFGSGMGPYTASDTAGMVIDFLDYRSSSKGKTVKFAAGNTDSTSTQRVAFGGGLWDSTAAISSITISCPVSFVAGSTFHLYGIQG